MSKVVYEFTLIKYFSLLISSPFSFYFLHHGVLGGDILAVKKMSTDASEEVNMLKKDQPFQSDPAAWLL